MKKIVFIFGLSSLLTITAFSQTHSIKFEHGSFKEIKAKALKENKLIFIDAYTVWCGPCKQMAKNVFTDDAVARYYNANLINAKIDMEKGEGIEIAKMYEVSCYPNLLFVDGNGNLVHRIAGSMTPKDFILLAENAKNPEKQFSTFVKNYEANKTNADFLLKYIDARESTCLDSKEMVKTYFSLQKEEDLTSKANWEMINYHVNDRESNVFKYVLNNKKMFTDLYSEKEVNGKIDGVNQMALNTIIRTKPFNEVLYKETKASIELFNTPDTKMIFLEADMLYAERTGNWDVYTKLAVNNVDNYYLKNPETLNSIAWTFYEKVADKEGMIKAETWAKTACDLNMSYANFDTYAAVLFKNNKKELALEAANKAIELAMKENYVAEDYASTTSLIEKIKALK